MHAIQHFLTITNHKWIVLKLCFRAGLYWQGLVHDLSKYSWTEFRVGMKYYRGDSSPNNGERMEKGYSLSWLHHKGRNKHHSEYWIDYDYQRRGVLVGMKMPTKYVVEMFFDRIAACKNYQKENYTQKSPWIYYERGKPYTVMHPESMALLERLLLALAQDGEEEAIALAKKVLKKGI